MSHPVLDYQAPIDGRPKGFRWPVVIGIGLFISALLASVILPALNTRGRHDPATKCASNLRQIGTAFSLYANENRGAIAADFVTLLETEDLVPEVFVCGSTNDERASTQPTELRKDFAAGGHCSYVYVASDGSMNSVTANDILAYEPPANHGFDWTWVLFADGRVERIDVKRLNVALATRPVRLIAE